MDLKIGKQLHCKKEYHLENGFSYYHCNIGEIFIITEEQFSNGIKTIRLFIADKIEFANVNKINHKIVRNLWCISERNIIEGIEYMPYIWDVFETKEDRAKRIINEFERR